jgi:hypothetical protein
VQHVQAMIEAQKCVQEKMRPLRQSVKAWLRLRTPKVLLAAAGLFANFRAQIAVEGNCGPWSLLRSTLIFYLHKLINKSPQPAHDRGRGRAQGAALLTKRSKNAKEKNLAITLSVSVTWLMESAPACKFWTLLDAKIFPLLGLLIHWCETVLGVCA